MAIALTGLRVWTGRGDRVTRSGVTLRTSGGRIQAIGTDPSLCADARVFALDGATAIPGLIDAHVHLTLDPAIRQPSEQEATGDGERMGAMQARARRMLEAGITTARDLGGGRWLELDLRDRIARGEVPGPRVLCAGQPITSPGGHCHFWGGEARGPLGIRAVMRRQLERGVDWIKVMATGGVMTRGTRTDDAQFDADELAALVDGAASAGRSVAAHCHGTTGIHRAAEAGVRTVEHCSFAGNDGFGRDFDPRVVEALARRAARGSLWVSPTVNAGWRRFRPLVDAPTPFGERMSRVLRGLREAGVPIIASTDAGIPGVEHHRLPEALSVMADFAGLDPVACLRSATSESAEALGLADETGRLEPGLSADVLVCKGDPLEDLTALRKPLLVMARGQIGADLRDEGTRSQ